MQIEQVQIASRFRGPPRSGNGGYTCGVVARRLTDAGAVAVRLKAPPPLERDLQLESQSAQARLLDGDAVIGEARLAQLDLEPPPAPSYDLAEATSRAFSGFRKHPFPGCFVCGTERGVHDGLRIHPGALSNASIIAGPWVPDATLADGAGNVKKEFLWAALDCPGAFVVMPSQHGTTIVLGELFARISGEAHVDERCVVIAWPLGAEGRKRFAGSAIYGADGRLIACARAVWIEVASEGWK